MKILSYTCPFTGVNFKLLQQENENMLTCYHAITGMEFKIKLDNENLTIPLSAFTPVETVSLNKAAQMLGVTKQRVSALIKAGKIDALKVNGRYKIPTGSVRNYDAMARGRKW